MNSVNLSLAVYISVAYILLVPICAGIIYYYAENGFPWHSYITLLVGLYTALGILLLIPLDISVVVYDRRSTSIGYENDYQRHVLLLSQIYNTYFTVVLIFGSVVLVFEEYYNTDGHFTIQSRLKNAFRRMCYDLTVPAIVEAILLGVLIGKEVVPSSVDALKLTFIILTNTVYELVLTILLAYSLVEYPRSIWRQADYKASLLKMQIKASYQFAAIRDAHFNVSLAVADVRKTKQALNSYHDPELNDAIDILTSECPPGFHADREGEVAQNEEGKITIDTLAKLRTQLNIRKDGYKMARAKVEVTKLLAYTLEDLTKACKDTSLRKIRWTLTNEETNEDEYLWYMKYKPNLLKGAAIICACFSVLSFLGVICSMKGVSNAVSPYFLAVHGPNVNPVGIFVFIFLSFGYSVYITIWAIFEIKMGAAYELVPSQTTPEALSFNVRMIGRIAAPLAFFYLGWISENGIRSGPWIRNDVYNAIYYENITVLVNSKYITELQMINSTAIAMPSAFSHFYQLQAIGTVQTVFETIFPCILYVVLALFLLNIFNRLLIWAKLDNYQFGTEIVTEYQLKEGKKQLQREKDLAIRRYRRERSKSIINSFLSQFKEDITSDNSEISIDQGFFSILLGKKATTNYLPVGERPMIKEPSELNGVIQRKHQSSLKKRGTWKEVYAEVRSPGYLHLYKDKSTADANRIYEADRSSDPHARVIDLTLVNEFLPLRQENNNVSFELHLELTDETLKFKFKNVSELEQWKSGLEEWKAYAINFGEWYPYGLTENNTPDIELGSVHNVNPSPSSNDADRPRKNELEIVKIERDDEPLLPVDSRATSHSWFGWVNPQKKKDLYESIFSTESSSLLDQKPAPLEGWLEIRVYSKVEGGEWQKRLQMELIEFLTIKYLRIDEKRGVLTYSKSSNAEEKSSIIDLRMVKGIMAYEKDSKLDTTRFNIDCGEKIEKFKARDEHEGQLWIAGLTAWKDYYLVNHKEDVEN